MNYHLVEFERSFGTAGQLPQSDLPELAFAGKSNVGKSSTLNKLFNRKQLARVSAVPGKTATINFFKAGTLRFVDLPGYGYAKVAKAEQERWSRLMQGYFDMKRDLRMVFSLLDMRHPPTADDVTMLDFLHEHSIPFAVILTKKDKLNKTEQKQQMEAFTEFLEEYHCVRIIPFSSKTGEGVEDVKALIAEIETAVETEKKVQSTEEAQAENPE